EGGSERGIEPHRLFIVAGGAVLISLEEVRGASAAVGVGEIGLEADRRAVVGDGAIEVALVLVRVAPVVVGEDCRGGGAVGRGAGRVAGVRGGAGRVGRVPGGCAPVELGSRRIWGL